MANYIIIGGDGKQYGPVTPEQLRQWIADGRANGDTSVQLEGGTEWKTLSSFAEFAGALGLGTPPGAPPPLTVPKDGRADARRRVKAPATALMVTAILNLLLAVWESVSAALFPPNLDQLNSQLQQLNNPQIQEMIQKLMHLTSGPVGLVGNLLGLAMSALILVGVSKMMALRSYEFSVTAAILSMVPCVTPCCVIGLPFGIWALIVLRLPEVKSQFH